MVRRVAELAPIQFPFSEMLTRVARNNHVPLHFCLLKLWVACFGDSLLSMRLLSVLFGEVTILGAYLFTIESFRLGSAKQVTPATRQWAALAAAAFIAISLPQVCYSREARMYSLGTSLVFAVQLHTLSRTSL